LFLAAGTAGYEAASLRQGDILREIPFPLLEHSRIRILGSLAQDAQFLAGVPNTTTWTQEVNRDKQWVAIQVPARFGFFAITTHCCEMEPRAGKIRAPTITLARLRPIPDDLRNNAENFANLRANRDTSQPDTIGYKEYFYLEPHALINGHDWSVHFNQAVTLQTSDLTILLAKKVLQMDDRTRAKFKTKLAYSTGKYTDEELAAGLDNPWNEPQNQPQLADQAQQPAPADGPGGPTPAPDSSNVV
jgi:hypothetical protein